MHIAETEKPTTATRAAPTVWLLLGEKAGEIAQLRLVAANLGWPVVEQALSTARDFGLKPPWPELALSFGKSLPAALHLQRVSAGHTRLVHFGRPRRMRMDRLDLIVPMPPDRVPAARNVLSLRMPLNRQDAAALAAGAEKIAPRLAALPRPWTALIVGGRTRHLEFDSAVATTLGTAAAAHAKARRGSLLVSTSPRTASATTDALRAAIDVPCAFYEFRAGDSENPLAGYLALADDIIVSGDSASMLAEAWRTGKPVRVARLPRRAATPLRAAQRILDHLPGMEDRLVHGGWVAARTDLPRWLDTLVQQGLVGELGGAAPRIPFANELDDDLARCVQRIRSLVDS
ncbi:MAG: hypothetical protein JWR16_3634 [Nevskia sp.]|nr:hypothetical protein [Nevskia sp.]